MATAPTADDVGLLAHVVKVDSLDARFARDDLGGLGRDHADARLGLRQRDLDVDVALHEGTVGEDLAHVLRTERVAEQGGIDDGAGGGDGVVGHGATLWWGDGFANMFEQMTLNMFEHVWQIRVYPIRTESDVVKPDEQNQRGGDRHTTS